MPGIAEVLGSIAAVLGRNQRAGLGQHTERKQQFALAAIGNLESQTRTTLTGLDSGGEEPVPAGEAGRRGSQKSFGRA